jgi:hypothetical protein
MYISSIKMGIFWLFTNVVCVRLKILLRPGLSCSKQHFHYLGVQIYFGVKSMDLTEGDNAKLVTEFLLNNRALVSIVWVQFQVMKSENLKINW